MKKITLIVLMLLSYVGFSQVDSSSLMGIPMVTNLSEITTLTAVNKGQVAYVDAEKSLYIYNGTDWAKILDNSPKITNETLREDSNFIYVSVKIETNNWMVTRYHKNDINVETIAMGVGVQPTTLSSVSSLTYN